MRYKLKVVWVCLLVIVPLVFLAVNAFSYTPQDAKPLTKIVGVESSATESTDNIANNLKLENVGADNYYIDLFKDSIGSIAGVFDNFIAFTPDPTGKVSCTNNNGTTSLGCTLLGTPNSNITFPASNAVIPSTTYMVGKLAGVAYLIVILLICIQGYGIMTNPEGENLRTFGIRMAAWLTLTILTPFILSGSVVLVNLLSAQLIDNISLTKYLADFAASIKVTPEPGNFFQELLNNTIGSFVSGTPNMISAIAALPFTIPMGMVMLLLLYISFQFIIRFLYLYFLAAVYPITIVFALHPKTQPIVDNYWRQWTTFIIQQPVFIIGFVLMKDILASLFKGTLSFEGIIIFVALLLFLCSINLLAGRLWGDVYSVISQNVTAAIGAGVAKSTLIDKPMQTTGEIAKMLTSKDAFAAAKKVLTFGKDVASKGLETIGDSLNKKKKLDLPGTSVSPLAKELRGSGFSTYDQGNGKLNVSGNFYGPKNAEAGMTTPLYTNFQSAVRDGHKPSEIRQYPMQNLGIQDTSNKKQMNKYNDAIMQTAAENGGHAKGIGLGYRSADQKVMKNMDIGREHNLSKGIQGVGVKNEAPGGDKSITGDNVLKIHAYSEVVRNKS